MKQYKLIRAYKATEELSRNDKLSANTLWSLYNLRKMLAPHWEFQNEREESLRNKYAEFADEQGRLVGEHYNNFIKDLAEIAEMDKDIGDFEKVKITLQDNLGLTIEKMEALDEFVEFEK